jgi:hypothetical protein
MRQYLTTKSKKKERKERGEGGDKLYIRARISNGATDESQRRNAPAGKLNTPAPMMLFTKLKISSGMVAVPSVATASPPPPPPPDMPSAVADHGAAAAAADVRLCRRSQLPPAAASGTLASEEPPTSRLFAARGARGVEEGATNASALTNAAIGMAATSEAALTLILVVFVC